MEKSDHKVELLVTTGDCDSIFGERYFDALEEDYWKLTEEVEEGFIGLRLSRECFLSFSSVSTPSGSPRCSTASTSTNRPSLYASLDC